MSFFYYYCWMAMNIFCGLFQFYLIDTVKKGRESGGRHAPKVRGSDSNPGWTVSAVWHVAAHSTHWAKPAPQDAHGHLTRLFLYYDVIFIMTCDRRRWFPLKNEWHKQLLFNFPNTAINHIKADLWKAQRGQKTRKMQSQIYPVQLSISVCERMKWRDSMLWVLLCYLNDS